MKYFIDTEFIEGFYEPLFGKRKHFIDLISIGIVSRDGREYYAISNEYDYKDADCWVKENVILPMYRELPPFHKEHCDPSNFHKRYGKSNRQIRDEIKSFVGVTIDDWDNEGTEKGIEFYGYYADYDWVLFCSLFGRMIDLPKGFPMYCKDLKQLLDDIGLDKQWKRLNSPDPEGEHNALIDAKWNKNLYEGILKHEKKTKQHYDKQNSK